MPRYDLAKLAALEAEFDGPIPAHRLRACLQDTAAQDYARATSAIRLCERHLAEHVNMTEADRALYRRWIAEWTAWRDAGREGGI